MPIPVLIAGPDAVILWSNLAFAKAAGVSRESAVGRPLSVFRRDSSGSSPFAETWKAVLSGETRTVEALHLYSGIARSVREVLVPLNGGGTVEQVAVVEQEQADSPLRSVLDGAVDGILVRDRAGRTAGYNRHFLDIWRLPESTASEGGNALLQALGAQLKAPGRLLGHSGTTADSQDELECVDGRILEWYRRPWLANDTVQGVVWSFRDVTGRRRADDQSRQTNEALERRMGERTGQLARTVDALRDEIRERMRIEEALRDSEERMRMKLDSILSPDLEINEQDLENILDIPATQLLMEDVTRLTGLVTAILDLKGKILVATGWQRVCTQFHRINPETSRNCTESDLYLARNVRRGEYVAYKCRNQLWDVVTPLFIGEKYVGNIYTGQFFYDDEPIDEASFRAQAARCGMDPEAYMAAIAEVPRVSREHVRTLMDFLARFSGMISRLSYGNLKLARAISEQKRADAALRDSEERFRLLVARAPVPIAINGETGAIEYVNERFLATFGYTLQDVPDVDTWFLKAYPDPDYRVSVRQAWSQLVDAARVSNGEIETREYQITCKDGTTRSVEVFGTPIGNRLLVLLNDISERKRNEQEQARLEEQLQQAQKMEAVGRLAGGIAHDFNNLLTVINGYSELVLNQVPMESDLRGGLEQIHEAGSRASELTRQLLAFSRKQVTQPSVLNLNEVVRGSRQMLERMIGEDIELVCELEPALWNVKADAGQLQQVLMNLVVNARDAMPEGGRLAIATYNLEFDNASMAPVPAVVPGAYALLSVRDSGMGMSEDVRRHIFEPFFTTKEQGKGTGLGLAMVFGIVRQSGGQVWADSQLGIGSTLHVCLPRADAPLAERKLKDHRTSDASGDETVLVVEDQPEVLKLACTILESYGYHVMGASNGEEALRVCSEFEGNIHAMITDVVMPRMNGWELTARVIANRPGIRVLYMSGYTGKVPVQEALGSGVVDFIQKPFTPEGLATALRRSLDRIKS